MTKRDHVDELMAALTAEEAVTHRCSCLLCRREHRLCLLLIMADLLPFTINNHVFAPPPPRVLGRKCTGGAPAAKKA